MEFLYMGNQKDGSNLQQASSELKRSVKYLVQSLEGKDDINGFLKRLSEYCDSIIVRNTDEGRDFCEGTCILKVNESNIKVIDIILSFRFQNKDHVLEEHRYMNQVSRQNFTDNAYEELLDKRAMIYEITR